MNELKLRLAQLGAIAGALGLLGTRVFATSYVMDSSVSSGVSDLLSSLVTTIFGQIVVAIGLVGALFVTLHGINWLIGFFKRHMQ